MNHINYFVKDNRLYQPEKADIKFFYVDEGYEKGNMDSKLYKGYQHYQPTKVYLKDEKERLMYEIQKYGFAVNDIGLYLDLFTDQQEILDLYHQYALKLHELTTLYQTKYGPLTKGIMVSMNVPFDWPSNFPWGGQ